MASIEWRLTALDDLLAIDRYRQRHRLIPIRTALARAVESYFGGYRAVTVLQGKPVKVEELPADIRLTRVYVGRTGGPYRILFRFDARENAFEIFRVAHPRKNARRA